MPETKPLPLSDFEKSLPHHEMICVEGGVYQMGGADENAYDDEKPLHQVRVSSFFMAKYPVTQAVYEKVMDGKNPSNFKGENRPVEKVSWDDAKIFLEKLNSLTGKKYRLPTEAEWEFAARGGKYSEGFLYGGSDKLKEVGWYDENSGGETHPVGQLLPNELGLCDMSGNVYELCEDDWHDTYQGAPDDGSTWVDSPERAAGRVFRGGDWGDGARFCRVSFRINYSPGVRGDGIGFRLVVSSQAGG